MFEIGVISWFTCFFVCVFIKDYHTELGCDSSMLNKETSTQNKALFVVKDRTYVQLLGIKGCKHDFLKRYRKI